MRNAIHSAEVMRQRTAAEDPAGPSFRQGYRPCLCAFPPPRRVLLSRMRKNCMSTTALFLLMLVLGLAENSYLQGGKYAHSSLSEGLRILLIGLTLPQVVLIVRIHRDGIALRASSDEIHPCSTV